MSSNIISYILDGRVAFPEVGLTESSQSEPRPIRLDRFVAGIDDERAPIISAALASAFREGECLIALNIEDQKALSAAPYMRRFLDQKLGISPGSHGFSMLGNSVLMPSSRVCLDDFEPIIERLVRSQLLFLIIFGVSEPRNLSVDWSLIYAGKQSPVADYLQPEEVALFRPSLKSQTIFELSTIRLT